MPNKSTHPSHEEDVDATEEQGIVKKLSKDQKRSAYASGDKDEDVYDKDGAEALRDDDEIDDWEEGFMEGARGGGKDANCSSCGDALPPKPKIVEKKVNGELRFFCSSKCASKGRP